jgi:hypothetical protein
VSGAHSKEAPLHERAAAAARAELRGERTRILGATGETTLRSLIRAHRVPARWTVPHVMDRMEEGFRTLSRIPLQSTPTPGDTFTVYQGCDHTPGTCASKFSNLANFRGFPYVPPPQMAI